MKNKQGIKRSVPPQEPSGNDQSTPSSTLRAHRSSATDDQVPVSVLNPDNNKKATPRPLLPRQKPVPTSTAPSSQQPLAESTLPTSPVSKSKRTASSRGRKRSAGKERPVEQGSESDIASSPPPSSKSRRGMKRSKLDIENIKQQQQDEKNPIPQKPRRATSPAAQDTSVERPRNIQSIIYGRYKIGTWYYSPYPAEFGDKVDELFICEHCLKYTPHDHELRAHKLHCKRRKPPGRVIYEQNHIRVYEVDGREHKLYCQNLCLMSKLFLETKTLYYDVEGFTFYVLTEQDRTLDLFVGYFSKEKLSYDNYNLACIMILPPQQRNGYGRLLIELSYELSKRQGVIGSPEKPLSVLGARGYRSFWGATLLSTLNSFQGQMTIKDLSDQTGIHPDDVISTLTWLDLLKYWEPVPPPSPSQVDEHQRPPPPPTSLAVRVCIKTDMIQSAIEQHRLRLTKMLNPSLIRWP
ncbi:histone acetyltransferase myst1 [Lichtheimia corymbifera JMRC:FSU:9682]|uniref:histone acetyltransferase n=1 Tax=Lichtheimia corymbifera JMRC:FSU:9682 TaxID=1263082 RepID=A0A068RTF9_9FUNG|nr:histone acetyltransferase myst1 [Lichtheimia corymbifera JMRC:FSU:9682]